MRNLRHPHRLSNDLRQPVTRHNVDQEVHKWSQDTESGQQDSHLQSMRYLRRELQEQPGMCSRCRYRQKSCSGMMVPGSPQFTHRTSSCTMWPSATEPCH